MKLKAILQYGKVIEYRNSLQMFKDNKVEQCLPKTCFFQCGNQDFREMERMDQEYGLYELVKTHPKVKTQVRTIPLIQLGCRSTNSISSSKKTQGKISIKEKMKSIERSKQKKLSLKKNSLRNSQCRSLKKGQLITQQYHCGKEPSGKNNLFQNDYQQYYEVSKPEPSVWSTDNSSTSVRLKFNSPKEKQYLLNNISSTHFQEKSKRNNEICITDLSRRENSTPSTPIRNHTFRLGQNLPTLRSESDQSGAQFSERSEVVKY